MKHLYITQDHLKMEDWIALTEAAHYDAGIVLLERLQVRVQQTRKMHKCNSGGNGTVCSSVRGLFA